MGTNWLLSWFQRFDSTDNCHLGFCFICLIGVVFGFWKRHLMHIFVHLGMVSYIVLIFQIWTLAHIQLLFDDAILQAKDFLMGVNSFPEPWLYFLEITLAENKDNIHKTLYLQLYCFNHQLLTFLFLFWWWLNPSHRLKPKQTHSETLIQKIYHKIDSHHY